MRMTDALVLLCLHICMFRVYVAIDFFSEPPSLTVNSKYSLSLSRCFAVVRSDECALFLKKKV